MSTNREIFDRETSPLSEFGEEKAEMFRRAPIAELSDKVGVRRIVRLRLETKPGQDYWSVMYCWGEASGGPPVNVALPFATLPRDGWTAALFGEFKAVGRYAKIMNVFEPGVLSKKW